MPESRELLERKVALFAEAEQVSNMGWWSWDSSTGEVFWSDNAYRLHHLVPGSVTPSLQALFASVHPEDLERVMGVLEAGKRTQTTPSMEYRLVGPDGSIRHVSAQGTSIFDEHGEMRYRVGTIIDRTETVEREQVAERNRVLLSETQVAGASYAFECWLDSGLIHGSPEFYRFLGLARDQPIAVSALQAMVHPDERSSAPLLADSDSPLEETRRQRVRLQLPTGEAQVVLLSSLQELAGGTRYVAGVLADVSERALLEEKLRAAQKLEILGRLSAGISHDFNNLLTVIVANAVMLNEDHPSPELEAIIEAGRKGTDLTRRLLSVGKVNRAKPGPLDMDAVVFKSVRLLKGVLGSGVRLQTTLSSHAKAICEAQRLQQVVFNLVINAHDALDGKGEIRIETALSTLENQPAVKVQVSDDGPGIPPHVLERVFEPFFTTKEEGRGSGLGLAMVREIVEELKGKIRIQSVVGAGTTVTMWFLQAEQCEPTCGERAPLVLIIEDDPQVRGLIRHILERDGYRVAEADSPGHAQACMDEELPDLLISDLSMPEGGGRAVLAELQRQDSPIPILMISGYGLEELGFEAPFLRKPFTPSELRAAVRALRPLKEEAL